MGIPEEFKIEKIDVVGAFGKCEGTTRVPVRYATLLYRWASSK
jgi:hypothetical protein